jgi:hypothetical protein
LDEDAGAVASLRITPRRTTVREVDEDLETLANNPVTLVSADAGDESHAASIMLIARMIEPLRIGDAGATIGCLHGNPYEEWIW